MKQLLSQSRQYYRDLQQNQSTEQKLNQPSNHLLLWAEKVQTTALAWGSTF